LNIYFYDNFSSSYNRFGNRVSEKLVDHDPGVKIFYIHDNYDKQTLLLSDRIKNNIVAIKPSSVKQWAKEYPPTSFLCFSYRIPDMYWTLFFNKINIPTFQVMHGIYVKTYKRNIIFLVKELPRIFSYLRYLFKIIRLSDKKTQVMTNLIKKDLAYIKASKEVDQDTLSNTLILWGIHWKEWFQENYGYNENNCYEVCGSFDLALLRDKKNLIEEHQDSITYIAQTISEDGRIEESYFFEFLKNLEKLIIKTGTHFYIKLHPRSNDKYYSAFEKYGNVTITTKFPISDVYITHYSALLTVPLHLRKKIVMVQFPNHPIPDEYIYMSPNIIMHDQDIDINSIKESTGDFERYFAFKTDPHDEVAKIVMALKKCGDN
jgi:hypothetical protein